MESYLDVVKEGAANLQKTKEFYPVVCQKWPSFLAGGIAREGKAFWEEYITKDNYLLTVASFTDPSCTGYLEWIMASKFADQALVLAIVAKFCKSSLVLSKCKEIYSKKKDLFLYSVLEGDNLQVLVSLFKTERPNFAKMVDMFQMCLCNSSEECVKYLAKEIKLNFESQPMDEGIWISLQIYNDHSVAAYLNEFLRVTPSSGTTVQGRPFKEAMLGSREEVEKAIDVVYPDPFSATISLISRIATEEVFANVMYNIMESNRLFENEAYNDMVLSATLSSKRDYLHTRNIIGALNKRGIIFNNDWKVDVAGVSENSMVALFLSKEVLDLEKILRHSYQPELKSVYSETVLEKLFPLLKPLDATNLFIRLDSKMAQWVYGQGLLKTLHNPEFYIHKAIKIGKVFFAALATEQMKEPLAISTIPMNNNIRPLLSFWKKATPLQKQRFFYEQFGRNFAEVSVYYSTELQANLCKRRIDNDYLMENVLVG